MVTKASERTTTLSQVFTPAPSRFLSASLAYRHRRAPCSGSWALNHRVFDDDAVVEDDLPPQIADHLLVVRGKEKRRLEVAAQSGHRVQDVPRVLRVQVRGRLVGQDDRRPLDDGARDGHALTLPAGQLGRPGIRPVGEPDPFERVHHRLVAARRAASPAPAAETRRSRRPCRPETGCASGR